MSLRINTPSRGSSWNWLRRLINHHLRTLQWAIRKRTGTVQKIPRRSKPTVSSSIFSIVNYQHSLYHTHDVFQWKPATGSTNQRRIKANWLGPPLFHVVDSYSQEHTKSFVKAWRPSNSLYYRSLFKVREMRKTRGRERTPGGILPPFKSRRLPACGWCKSGITEYGLGMDIWQKSPLLPFSIICTGGGTLPGLSPPLMLSWEVLADWLSLYTHTHTLSL